MKRSEVINFLSNEFYYCNVDPDEADKKAEIVLSKLEEMGMIPPVNEKLNPATIMAGEAYEWEPE